MKKAECEAIDRRLKDLENLYRGNVVIINTPMYMKIESILNAAYINISDVLGKR